MFNNVVYLNRDQDTDRRAATESQFNEYGVKANRFSAITEKLEDYLTEPVSSLRISTPQASCLLSHLEILRAYGDSDILVFEDDIDLSPSRYWGDTFTNIINCTDPSIGIVQLSAFPSPNPTIPRMWVPGYFGTGAYYIKSWYARELIELGYKDGKWDIKAFKSHYSQPLADSILYSNTRALSLNLFGIRPVKSTILPHATYTETAATYSESWYKGVNDLNLIKERLALRA